ncbi:serine/threonine-protein kinase [Prauserella shujinwangii]|uniref:non-specific serine/threonine protein kinase n=1 Tax=Prauserella shujinwangii TaxID=1453103 RepID=A0A2T0LL42_9PSEU|nr:serine/threonine-protein kinase [Prauserella shujinwangii]PRX43622.1 serine/threonine-protein kinase [Prauserella shujinwangii]
MTEQFGPYRLESLIGRGGMGEVYRAVDTTKDRVVAVKRLPAAFAADPGFQARFRRESRVAARLREPHVIPIHDYGEIDGQPFLDMRLVEGVDLGELLAREGALEPARAVRIIAQVAGALDAAHADGLVHRDVKPSNVLVSHGDGETDHVYLVDFGIASAATDTRLTGTGDTVGTPHYMAPERFTGGEVDLRADVYSLSCVLYEALTAQRPFRGEGMPAQMYAHLHHNPPAPARARRGVPAGLDAVVARGMAKKPDERYARAGELAAAARAALAPGTAATVELGDAPATTATLPGAAATAGEARTEPVGAAPRRRRGRVPLAVSGALVAVAVTAGVVLLNLPSSGGGTSPPPGTGEPGSSLDLVAEAGPVVPVGALPESVALTPDGRRAYVANAADDTVSVLDTRRNEVVATVPVGDDPGGIAVSPDGTKVYVANFRTDTISVIETGNNTVTATIPAGRGPDRVAFGPEGSDRGYVTNAVAGAVSVLDLRNDTIVGTVDVGAKPFEVMVSPGGGQLYVTDFTDDSVTVVDTAGGTVTGTIPVGTRPQDSAFSPDGRRAYIPNESDGTVAVIDTRSRSVVARIDVGAQPQGVAVAPDGESVYVVSAGPGTLSVIDAAANQVTGVVPVGADPRDVVLAPGGRRAYVPLGEPGEVAVVEFAAKR